MKRDSQRRPRNDDNNDLLLNDHYMNPRVPLNNSSNKNGLDIKKQKSKSDLVNKLYESKGIVSQKNASNPSKMVIVDQDPDKNSQKVNNYIVEQNHH